MDCLKFVVYCVFLELIPYSLTYGSRPCLYRARTISRKGVVGYIRFKHTASVDRKAVFAVGYWGFAAKTRNHPGAGKKILTDIIVDLILPCSIVCSFLVELTVDRLRQTAEIFFLSGNPVIQLSAGTICIPELYTGASAGYAVCHDLLKLRYSGDSHCRGHFRADGTLLAAVFLIPLRVVMWTLGLSFLLGKVENFL